MIKTFTTADIFALLVGILLLVQGIWDVVDPPFLEIFASNLFHAVIHILLGIIGIWTALRSGAYTFLIFLGIVLLTVGAMFFIEPAKGFLVETFGINKPVALLNLFLGAFSLLVVIFGNKPVPEATKARPE